MFKREFRIATALILIAVYFLIYSAFDGLRFQLKDDENHFWPNSQIFAETWLPSLYALRHYNELNTPFPFIVFGWLHKLTSNGLVVGRIFNVLSSLGILLLLCWQAKERNPLWRALAGILIFPYFQATSVLLYTDIQAVFWIVLGFWAWQKDRAFLSAFAFSIAVACRQFALAFPAALLIHELDIARQRGHLEIRWPMLIAQITALASIIPWLWLWGGLAPPNTAAGQGLPADFTLRRFVPENSLYFMATLGAYFVLPELVLRFRTSYFPNWRNIKIILSLLSLGLLFCLFPPFGNAMDIPTMGILDISVRNFFSDLPRLILFAVLAGLALWRFSRLDLASLLVLCNALLMLKSKVAWDKYLLPLLVVLWWQYATSEQDD